MRRRGAALARGRAPIAALAALLGLAPLGCSTCPETQTQEPRTPGREPQARGQGTLVGQLRLVPRADAAARSSARDPNELGDARFVDYSTPGFAVVYLEDAPPAAVTFPLSIETSDSGPHLVPVNGALGAGGALAITNRTAEAHVVSCPEAGVLARIPPRQTLEIPVRQAGPLSLFLLDRPGPMAQLFAAPGPYTVVSGAGTWELHGVRPGPHQLRTWHPRFAGTMRPVDVQADQVLRLQLEVGVERGDD